MPIAFATVTAFTTFFELPDVEMSPVNYHAITNGDADIINVMFSFNSCGTDSLFSLLVNTPPVINFDYQEGLFIKSLLMEIVNCEDVDY